MPGEVHGPMVFMITIVNRKRLEELAKIFDNEGITFHLCMLAKGTSNSKLSSYLGVGEKEKAVRINILPYDLSVQFLKKFEEELDINKPDSGISFTIPLGSICGFKSNTKLYNLSQAEGQGETMDKNFNHDLIIAITNRGFADEVMDAARAASATGGTIINARGTSRKEVEKFFGVTIQPEKELIMILATKENKDNIMESIISKAGPQTNAKTIAFSLPVNGVVGLASLIGENKEKR